MNNERNEINMSFFDAIHKNWTELIVTVWYWIGAFDLAVQSTFGADVSADADDKTKKRKQWKTIYFFFIVTL
jgi:hypothetical protein